MALKAGRVGVSPDQVDEFGKISSEATGAYTKQEADAKFETQSHASSTYETKTEASSALNLKQNINIAVPINVLNGSNLAAVEPALHGLENAITYVTKTYRKVSTANSAKTYIDISSAKYNTMFMFIQANSLDKYGIILLSRLYNDDLVGVPLCGNISAEAIGTSIILETKDNTGLRIKFPSYGGGVQAVLLSVINMGDVTNGTYE